MPDLSSYKNIFEAALLDEIATTCIEKKMIAGETMMDYGDTIRFIPIVLSGSIKVNRKNEEGQELLLYYILPKQSCAMSFTCCMTHRKSEIKAVVEDDVDLLLIPNNKMDEWMMKYVSWKSFVMLTFQTRFDELMKAIDSIAFQKLDERLIHSLKEKQKHSGSAVINITHQQLADELATSRVVISRLLKQLEIQNKLLLYRNQIKLLRDL